MYDSNWAKVNVSPSATRIERSTSNLEHRVVGGVFACSHVPEGRYSLPRKHAKDSETM